MTKSIVAFRSFANAPKNSLFLTGQGGSSGNASFAFRKCAFKSCLGHYPGIGFSLLSPGVQANAGIVLKNVS
jgi:hypothetical protein